MRWTTLGIVSAGAIRREPGVVGSRALVCDDERRAGGIWSLVSPVSRTPPLGDRRAARLAVGRDRTRPRHHTASMVGPAAWLYTGCRDRAHPADPGYLSCGAVAGRA